jgi:hypothetical protein
MATRKQHRTARRKWSSPIHLQALCCAATIQDVRKLWRSNHLAPRSSLSITSIAITIDGIIAEAIYFCQLATAGSSCGAIGHASLANRTTILLFRIQPAQPWHARQEQQQHGWVLCFRAAATHSARVDERATGLAKCVRVQITTTLALRKDQGNQAQRRWQCWCRRERSCECDPTPISTPQPGFLLGIIEGRKR